MLEGANRLLDLGRFLNQALATLEGILVVLGFLAQVTRLEPVVVRRAMICRGVLLQDGGRNFLLYDEGCTMFLDEILLGLLVCRVLFDQWGGTRGTRILSGFWMGPTRIRECLEVRL